MPDQRVTPERLCLILPVAMAGVGLDIADRSQPRAGSGLPALATRWASGRFPGTGLPWVLSRSRATCGGPASCYDWAPRNGGARAGVSACAAMESTCRLGESPSTRRPPMPAQRLSATMSGTSSWSHKTTKSRTPLAGGLSLLKGLRRRAGPVLGFLGSSTSCSFVCVAGLVIRRRGGLGGGLSDGFGRPPDGFAKDVQSGFGRHCSAVRRERQPWW